MPLKKQICCVKSDKYKLNIKFSYPLGLLKDVTILCNSFLQKKKKKLKSMYMKSEKLKEKTPEVILNGKV